MRIDPFAAYRNGGAAYIATTNADGWGLTLRAVDLALFHEVANEVIAARQQAPLARH